MNEQIEAIRAEIERRMEKHWDLLPDADSPEDDWTHNELYALGAYKELEHLETFVDSLPEEKPSEDLEEAAEDCVWKSIDNNDPTLVPKYIPLLLSLFISGAYWQKEQMMDEWLQDRDGCFWDGVEEGKKAMEKQMMKDAMDAIVENWNLDPEPEITIPLNPEEFTCGDKVRIIIVKEDNQ